MWCWFFDVVQQLTPQSQPCAAAAAITDRPCKMSNGLRVPSGINAEHYSSAKKMLICNKSNTCAIASRQEGPAFESTVGVFLHGVCLSFPSLCGFTPTPSQSPKNMHGVRLTGDSKDANVSMNGRLHVGPVTLKTDRWVHTGLKII